MATTSIPVSVRHRCMSNHSVLCTRGNGKPSRKSCKHCGSSLYVESGVWCVVPWTGDGRYRLEDAVSIHRSEAAAQSVVNGDVSDTLVVRFLEPR